MTCQLKEDPPEDGGDPCRSQSTACPPVRAIAGFLVVLALGRAEGQQWIQPGPVAGDGYGTAVASAGDINGDSFPEVAIGAPLRDSGGFTDNGAVEIRSGVTGELLRTLSGNGNNRGIGRRIAALGDVNGDGVVDLGVGGSAATPYFTVYSGATGAALWSFSGIRAFEAAGDLNNDGSPDLIASTLSFNLLNATWNWRYRAFSGPTGTSIWSNSSESANAALHPYLAYDVAVVADIIGSDGVKDFVTSLNESTGVMLVCSGATGVAFWGIVPGGGLPGNTGRLGTTLEALGDINSDGIPDLAIGDASEGPSQTPLPSPSVVRVMSAGFLTQPAVHYTLSVSDVNHRFGATLAGLGDIDGDGRPDFAIGAPQDHASFAATGPGYVRLVSGQTGNTIRTHTGSFGGEMSGAALASIDDLGCDFKRELVIGAPRLEATTENGAVGVWHTGRPCPQATPLVRITEVSFDGVIGVELTYLGTGTLLTALWRLRWEHGGIVTTVILPEDFVPGEGRIILAANSAPAGPGFLTLNYVSSFSLPQLPQPMPDTIRVQLEDQYLNPVDSVVIAAADGSAPLPSPTGLARHFRGAVPRPAGSVAVARIPGLDSDSAGDWTSEPVARRTFGRRNAGSGVRGTDPLPLRKAIINELVSNPDFIEVKNVSGAPLDLGGWTLRSSVGNGIEPSTIAPFPPAFVIPIDAFVVLGASGPPAELPQGTPYIQVAPPTFPAPFFDWGSQEFDCALYDGFGRLVDLVRVSDAPGLIVHQHPRAPSAWNDFSGIAPRATSGTAAALGRFTTTDTDSGSDWIAEFVRSLGSENPFGNVQGLPGTSSPLDLLAERGRYDGFQPDGLVLIWNAGPGAALHRVSTAFSFTHAHGAGPFFGMPADALFNFLQAGGNFPFGHVLDDRGSARFDLPPASLPPGFAMDLIGVLQAPNGLILGLTPILEVDI